MARLLTTLKFGEWLPDLPEYGNPGSPNVQNVYWVNGCYTAAPSFSALGAALPARCQGAYAAVDAAGNAHLYAGTAAKLMEYSGTGFTDRSAAGGYNAQDAEYWKFTQFSSPSFGNLVLATDFADPVQSLSVGGAQFAALAGSPPNASQIAVVNQFVMLGDTQDAVNGHVPYRVQWCAIGNPTNWVYATLAAQQAQAGAQYLDAVYGPVTHIADGYAHGLIFQRRGITRAYYTGDDAIFYFDTYEKQRGALFPNACVQLGNQVFFIAEDGFCMTEGQQVLQIGHGKVDNSFLNAVSQTYPDRVVGSLDPVNKLILWCYCSGGNSTGIPDQVIAYNYIENKFTPLTEPLSRVFTTKSFGYTMDTLDNVNTNLDAIAPSLDSPYWEGGNLQVGAFDAGNNYGQLGGASLAASIDTLETAPNAGGVTYIDGARPVMTGSPTANVQLLTRNLENAAYSLSPAASQNPATGRCDLRAAARYVRARINFTGGFNQASGVDLYGTRAGER